MKELMRSIAAGAILYEYFEESNAFLTAEIFERCIDLYKDLCAKDENAIKKCIEYIQKDEDLGFEYFYEPDAEKFLKRYNIDTQ